MSDNMIGAAFFQVCKDAQPARASYVSLYCRGCDYGGPEEGGWWVYPVTLEAYHRCTNDVEAEAVKAEVEKLARQMTEQSRQDFNRGCAQQLEAVEQLDPMDDTGGNAYFGEVGGAGEYFVVIEPRPGTQVYEPERVYS